MTPDAEKVDALEELKAWDKTLDHEWDVNVDCLTCRAIAAWEKERSEARTQYGRGYDQGYGQACDGCTALKELNALRASVQRVEEEAETALKRGETGESIIGRMQAALKKARTAE